MTNKEKRQALIDEFVRNNPEPIQELCPEFEIKYTCKEKSLNYKTWNSKTGNIRSSELGHDDSELRYEYRVRSDNTSTKERLKRWCRDRVIGLYVHYIPELDALELAKVTTTIHERKQGEKPEWIYDEHWFEQYRGNEDYNIRDINRIFLFHDDKDLHQASFSIDPILSRKETILDHLKEWENDNVVQDIIFTDKMNYTELRKFDPNATLNANTIPDIKDYRWWLTKQFNKKHRPNHMAYELNQLEIDYNECPCIVFQKLDENCSVLRCYEGIFYGTEVVEERYRIFIYTNKKVALMADPEGTDRWRNVRNVQDKVSTYHIKNIDDMKQFNPLRYLLPCFGSETNGKITCDIKLIINMLRHPIIEQLAKAGYTGMAYALSESQTITAYLKEFFFIEKESKTPILKLLGVNHHMMQRFEECFGINTNANYYVMKCIKEIKLFFGKTNIADIDDETFDRIFDMMIDEHINSSTWSTLRQLTKRLYGYSQLLDYNCFWPENARAFVFRMRNMESKHKGISRMYLDAIQTFNAIKSVLREHGDTVECNLPNIDLHNLKKSEDIVRIHDHLTEMYQSILKTIREKHDKVLNEKLKKLNKKRKSKFAYENKDWCIKIPETAIELSQEGCILNHCVAGYTDSYCNGETNILFLRKKSDENTPFYTIEINNDNHVTQIHGKYNCWLGNNPEAIPFMYEYLTKIHAKFDKTLLLNKGTGYTPSDENLDESYLTQTA